MKWVIDFIEGMCVAAIILVIAALVVGVFWASAEILELAMASRFSTAGVIAVVCVFFVACFGLFYSFWNRGE